jgi:hypothetical protein
MDYPFHRKYRSDQSDNWWLSRPLGGRQIDSNLPGPTDPAPGSSSHLKSYPLVSYLAEISSKDKFRFIVIGLIATTLVYRLDLSGSIWIGLIVACILAYYWRETEAQQLNNEADQLQRILNSNLLAKTKYFVSDPQLIKWVDNIGELKPLNVLQFNQLIRSLDQMLQTQADLRRGVSNVQATYDLYHDLKVASLNHFHAMVYKIPDPVRLEKYNHYLEELGKILNDREQQILRIKKLYYQRKPISRESSLAEMTLEEPRPTDYSYSPNYNFYVN